MCIVWSFFSDSVFNLCQNDIQTLCNDVLPGQNKLHECLTSHLKDKPPSLTESCVHYLKSGHEKAKSMVKKTLDPKNDENVAGKVEKVGHQVSIRKL